MTSPTGFPGASPRHERPVQPPPPAVPAQSGPPALPPVDWKRSRLDGLRPPVAARPPVLQARHAPAPVAAPAPVPDGLTEALDSQGRVRGDSMLGRGWRRLLRLVGRDSFPEQFAHAASRVQEAVPTGRRIVVLGLDGGAGRSTVAACLALVYGTLRRDVCAVVDLGSTPSALAARLGEPGATPAAVAGSSFRDHEPATRDEALQRLTRPAPGLALAASSPGGPSEEQYRALASTLSRTAAVTVLDCPAGLAHHSIRAAIADAHALVVVAPATTLGAAALARALPELQALGGAPVTVLTTRRPRTPGQLGAKDFAAACPGAGAVREFAWDRHLAASGRIHLDHLTEAHRLQLTVLAAELLAASRGGR